MSLGIARVQRYVMQNIDLKEGCQSKLK